MVTSSGSLVALHNGDGRKVWSRHYYAEDEGVRPQRIDSWRTYHSATLSPEAVVLLENATQSSNGLVAASVVDAHSGLEISRIQLAGPGTDITQILKIFPIHRIQHSDFDQSVYLIVGRGESPGSLAVKLLPDNEDTKTWFSSNYKTLFFWLENLEANTVSGYGFESSNGVPIKVWEVAPSEPILDIASRSPKEVVQSSVKVLGDRSIKYKVRERYSRPKRL